MEEAALTGGTSKENLGGHDVFWGWAVAVVIREGTVQVWLTITIVDPIYTETSHGARYAHDRS